MDKLMGAKCRCKGPLTPICYVCDKDLWFSFEIWGTPIIAIAGGIHAGKSCYIGALWHQIDSGIIASLFPPRGADHVEGLRNMLQFEKRLPETTLLNEAEKKTTLVPCGIRIEPRIQPNTPKSVVIYDIAGEAFRPGESGEDDLAVLEIIKRFARYIGTERVSGILFTVDPYTCFSIRDEHELPSEAEYDTANIEDWKNFTPEKMLRGIADYLRREHGLGANKALPINLAIVLTKLDIFSQELNIPAAVDYQKMYNGLREKLFDDAFASSDTGLDAFQQIHKQALELFGELKIRPLYNTFKNQFDNVFCFAVSSIGNHPHGQTLKDTGITPIAVEAPFLWLFRHAKLRENDNEIST